jgi:hypothetical protein
LSIFIFDFLPQFLQYLKENSSLKYSQNTLYIFLANFPVEMIMVCCMIPMKLLFSMASGAVPDITKGLDYKI